MYYATRVIITYHHGHYNNLPESLVSTEESIAFLFEGET